MQDSPPEVTTLTPVNLEDRFTIHSPYTPMTPAEAKAKVACDDWKTVWDHPQILQELLSDTPPTSLDALPYEFDLEDITTQDLLFKINGLQITSAMKQHVLTVKKQEFSRMHPKFGPFKLLCVDIKQDKYTVLNRKEDRAFTFKGKDYHLDLGNTAFDLHDATTYSLVCLLGAQILWDEVLRARNALVPEANEIKGPYKVTLTNRNSNIIFQNTEEQTWQSNLSPGPSPEPSWITVPPHGSSLTAPSITPTVTRNPSYTNRYSILQHRDITLSHNHMDVDKPSPGLHWQTDSDDDAAHSGDERTPPSLNLQDICALDSDTAESTLTNPSALTTTDPFKILDGTECQYLLTIEIQLQPGVEHLQVLFAETKSLLSYIQQVDPAAQFMSKALRPDGSPYPPLKSTNDKHWPSSYLASQSWYQSSMGYLFRQDPISEKQLLARLTNKKGFLKRDASQLNNNNKEPLEDKGPTSMYATMNLYTKYPAIERLLDSINVDLRKNKVRVSLKELQCWESSPKKILCGVNSNLCATGVRQLLLHKLKELEKKMCRHGRLNTIEWYDEPLPELIVSLRGIRPLKLPNDDEEKPRLTFDTFPWESKLAFYLEASDSAWYRLEPLLDLMIETNTLSNTFGPSAYVMEVPAQNQKISIEKVRSHHRIGRISMGYNIATTILECNEVQLFDYDVKVAMETVSETASDGTLMLITPKPPYAKTNLRKELQRIRFNGEQLFHTAVMTCTGPDSGMSRIVISYKPSDPLCSEKYNFAKRTISNLACFMHHWWIECGYNESTRKRLMRSFYIEKSRLAEHSSWDTNTKLAISHFATKTSTYLEDNADYDPQYTAVKNQGTKAPSVIDMSDQLRASLLKQLGQDGTRSPTDFNSNISNVSPHTGDGDVSCNSTVNSSNTTNKILKTKDFALQLADSRAKQAEQVSLIAQLQQQMEELKRLHSIAESGSQQGAPHLSGSGASPPTDPGGGEAPQGP